MRDERLLFINNSLSNGGSERVMAMLANEFCERGYKVDMLVLNPYIEETYTLSHNITRIDFCFGTARGIKYTLLLLRTMRELLKKNKYKAVISFLMNINVLTLLAAIGKKQRVIVSERCHPNILAAGGKLFKFAEQILYPCASQVVLQTEDVKKEYNRKIQKKCVVISNPVNPDIPMPYDEARCDKIIMSAGRLNEQKNYPLLIKAFARFSVQYEDYSLVIYGKGELESDLRELSRSLGIEHKVYFPGFCQNVDQKIRTASMFIMTSDYEGISNSMIEALAMGVPTICTDCPVGGARMMIEDGVSGLLTPVGDEDAVYNAMIKIASDESFAMSLGNEAVKIREKYSIDKIADQWEKIV